ncbi:type VI secretion system-associated FHA domain protein TagH [Xanthobacteraceae bacterium A53D]
MRARLTVSSEQRQSLGADATHDFGRAGGIIGRSAGCDWRLPDATHTLSGRHAEVRHNGHGFTIVDLSTNGLYVNSTDAPIGRGNSAVLVDGDVLYLGAYILSVSVDRNAQAEIPASPGMPELGLGAAASAPLYSASRPFAAGAGARPHDGVPQDPVAALDNADAVHPLNDVFPELGQVRSSRDIDPANVRLGWSAPRPPSAGPAYPMADAGPAARAFMPEMRAMPGGEPAQPRGPGGGNAIPENFLQELAGDLPDLAPPEADPADASPPLTISRGVSSRLAGLSSEELNDPVSLLRRRAAARAPVPVEQAAPPPAPVAAAPGSGPAEGDPANAIWALLELDGAQLSHAAKTQLLSEVAEVLVESADGLVAMLAARRMLKEQFQLDPTRLRPTENNPFKFNDDGRQALIQSLVRRPSGFLPAPAAARAGFRDMQIHEVAALEAMQATIARLLERVSPAAVTAYVEGEGQEVGLFGRKATDKGRLWDRYLMMHERLADALDVINPEIISGEFARAYAQHSKTLRGEQAT